MSAAGAAAVYQDISRPAVAVSVDGSPLPLAVALQLNRVCIDEDVDLPSMFSLELAGGDASGDTAWIDGSLFAIGAAVEIKLGYGSTLQSVIAAEVTSIEPEFSRGRHPALTVRGHDRRHRLMRGRKTRSFVQQKDSDIAAAIGAECGLSVQAQDSLVVHDYLLQCNQSNLDFLQDRARRIGYEFVLAGQTLHFRPVQNAQAETATLSFEDDLLEFRPRLSTMGQASAMALRGWSPKDKSEIVGNAGPGDEVSAMGGSSSGAAIAQKAFGDAPELQADWPVFSQAEADQLVRARFNRRLLGLVSGDGVCSGRTDLHPGQVIKINGIGTLFSGVYYLSGTGHRFSAGSAYETHFTVMRNAT